MPEAGSNHGCAARTLPPRESRADARQFTQPQLLLLPRPQIAAPAGHVATWSLMQVLNPDL
jgi:hypothetical protein